MIFLIITQICANHNQPPKSLLKGTFPQGSLYLCCRCKINMEHYPILDQSTDKLCLPALLQYK